MSKPLNVGNAFFVLTLSLFAGIANAQTAQPGANTASTSTPAGQAQPAMEMKDAEMAEIMKNVNQAEIDSAKMALKKASNPQVKEFANQMIKDHSENMKMQAEIAKKANMKTEQNDLAKKMKADAKSKMSELSKAKKGAEFDKAYMAAQVEMHQMALDQLKQMAPAAQNPDFKKHLQTTQEHVQHHLTQAQQLQSSVNK